MALLPRRSTAEPLGGFVIFEQIALHRQKACLLGLLAVFGCATGESPSASKGTFYPDGDYEHVVTGLTFPKAIGAFKRTHVSRYDTSSVSG